MQTVARQRRRLRVRSKVTGTAVRPRLSVNISNRHIVAQLIDDTAGRTLASVTTVGAGKQGKLTEQAAWVGQEIAVKATKLKVKAVVFDRAGRVYRARLHALAEAARQKGLEF
jgi:large subunit ribosomal protein L18